MNVLDESFEDFAARLFEYEYCPDCLGDVPDHEAWVVMGNWFAHCRQILAPGVVVASQDGENHRGVVLDERHPSDGWVWVEWEHIGRWDEDIIDLDIIGRAP